VAAVRLPLLPLAFACATLYGTVSYAADSIAWGIVAAVAALNVFMLAEWCIDAVVRELRKIGTRLR
jgi:hypothetical protein